jgi:hypothetical protein
MSPGNEWAENSSLRTHKHRLAVRFAARLWAWVVLCAGLVPRAAAQGCAMCYQNAAASGAQGQEALRHGILILLIPALGLFTGIFGLIYRRRNIAR